MIRYIILLGMAAFLCSQPACGTKQDKQEPSCEGVDCSGHGSCVLEGQNIRCDCDEGFSPDGLLCVEDEPDPCEAVDCSGHGVCVDTSGEAVCECDAGFYAEGLACLPEPCNEESLRAKVLAGGETLFKGVTLESTTALSDLQNDPASYEGQVVQVQGWVTYVCEMQRNSALLQNSAGETVKVAGDHTYDLTTFMSVGDYAIFEGVFFQNFCRRGPHVNFGSYGARAQAVSCPIPGE